MKVYLINISHSFTTVQGEAGKPGKSGERGPTGPQVRYDNTLLLYFIIYT